MFSVKGYQVLSMYRLNDLTAQNHEFDLGNENNQGLSEGHPVEVSGNQAEVENHSNTVIPSHENAKPLLENAQTMDAGSYRYGKNTPTTEEKASPLEQESKEPSSYNLHLNNPGSKVVPVTDEEIDKMLLSLSNAIKLANDCRKMEEHEPEDNLVLERKDALGSNQERETTELLAKENLVKIQNNLQESGLEQQEDSPKTEPLQSVDSEVSLEDLIREKNKRDVCLAREESELDRRVFLACIDDLNKEIASYKAILRKREAEHMCIMARMSQMATFYVNEKPKKYTQKSDQLSNLKIKLDETKDLHSENDQQKAEIQRLKDLLKSKEQVNFRTLKSKNKEAMPAHIVEFGNQSVKQFPTESLATENNTQLQEPAAETGKVQMFFPSLSERTARTGKEVCFTRGRKRKLEGEICKTLCQDVRQESTINTRHILRARVGIRNPTDMSEKTVLMKNELEKQNHEQKNEIQKLNKLVSDLQCKEQEHLQTIINSKHERVCLEKKIVTLLKNQIDSFIGQYKEIKVENDDKKENSNIQELKEPLEDRISISNSEESSRQEMDSMETSISKRSLMRELDSVEIDEQEIDEEEIDEQEIIPSNSQNNGEDTSGKWKNRLLIGGGCVAAAAAFYKYGPAMTVSNVMSIFNPNNYVGTWI